MSVRICTVAVASGRFKLESSEHSGTARRSAGGKSRTKATRSSQGAAVHTGKLLEDLPKLWSQATMEEQRCPLITMLDAVYVDAREEKRVVAIKPKPAFLALCKIATMAEGSGIVLVADAPEGHGDECCSVKMTRPPDALSEGPGAPCLWWRRGRVELPVQRALKGIYSRRSH